MAIERLKTEVDAPLNVDIKENIVLTNKPVHLKMSYDAFLEWADEDSHAEWVDGEVITFMPAKDVHKV